MVALFSTNASRKGARFSSDAKYALDLKERFFLCKIFIMTRQRKKNHVG